MLLLMSATSNYTDVGFTMGFAILGALILLMSLALIIMRIKNSDSAKEKRNCLIELGILLICIIVGYVSPAYSSTFHIVYSNIASIFVKPLLVYIIIFLLNLKKVGFLDDIGDSVFHLVFLFLSLCMFIFGGVALMGINYFAQNDSFLEWADKNFRYENRIMIDHRISKYNTEDFETIIIADLKNAKDYYEKEKYNQEKIKEEFLESPYGFSFELDDYQITEDKNIYICSFIDKARYNEQGEFPRYFAKINISDLSLVEIIENQSGSNNEEENEFLEQVEKEKETTIYNAIKYATINLKNKGLEVNKDNINKQLKYIKDTSITCKEVEEKNDDTYIVTMHMKREPFMSSPTYKDEQYIIKKDTYELSNYDN